jgi:hypothetical protein
MSDVAPYNSDYALYSIDISGTTPGSPLKISGTRTAGAMGVGRCEVLHQTSCTSGDQQFFFEISPTPPAATGLDAPYVAYSSDSDSPGIFKLHVASLTNNRLFDDSSTVGLTRFCGHIGSVLYGVHNAGQKEKNAGS